MERTRVGIIGCGYWGPNLIRNFSACPLTEVVAGCDASPARLEAVGDLLGPGDLVPDATTAQGAEDDDVVDESGTFQPAELAQPVDEWVADRADEADRPAA